MIRRFVTPAVVVAAGLPVSVLGQQTNWLDATSGNWSDAARWDNGVPGMLSDVVIDATGAAYESLVTSDFTLNSLLLDSADATLRIQSGGSLTLLDNAVIRNGIFALNGAAVNGGTLTFEAGAVQQYSSFGSNIFDGVTVIGDLNLSGTTSTLRLRNGTSVSGQINLTGSNARLGFEGTQTISGSTIVASGTSNKTITVEGDGVVTLAADSSISAERLTIGGAFAIGGNDRNFVNQGTINANVSSSTGIQVSGLNSFSNEGTINVSNGGRFVSVASAGSFSNSGTVSVVGAGSLFALRNANWTNSGMISVTDGTIELGGSTTTADAGIGAGRISGNADSTLNVTGTIDNTGASISSDSFAGDFRLSGGRLLGGSLLNVGGSELNFSNSGSNMLDGVTVDGDLNLSGTSSTVRLSNGTTVSGQISLTGSNARLGFDGTQTLSGMTINADGTTNLQLTLEGDGTTTLAADSTITARRLSIGGAFAIGGANRNFVNQGTIRADVANNSGINVLSLNSFTNEGQIEVSNGGRFTVASSAGEFANDGEITVFGADSLVALESGNWTNSGMIDVMGGTLRLGGTYSAASSGLTAGRIVGNSGGTLVLSGTLDNTGATFSTGDFGGDIRVEGARIDGGTLINMGGGALGFSSSGSNILDGVEVIGDLDLAGASSTVRWRAGTSVSGHVNMVGSNTRVGLEGTQTISDTDFVALGNTNSQLTVEGNGTVTLSTDTSVTAQRATLGGAFAIGGSDRNLISEGTIRANVANSTGIQVNGLNSFTNSGAVEVTNGGRFAVLTGVSMSSNAGDLTANGNNSRILIDSNVWDNSGNVTATGAGSEIAIRANDWSNNGMISVTDGRLELGGGFTTDGSGLNAGRISGNAASRLDISGALDNTGSSFSTGDFAGQVRLAGGRITGGTLNNLMGDDLEFTSSTGNILDGVSVNGDLTLGGSSSTVRWRNGVTVSTGQVNLTGSNARLGFEGTQTLEGTDFVSVGNASKQLTIESNGTTVTLAADSSISGQRLNIGGAFVSGGADRHFVNLGNINANEANSTGIQATSMGTFTNDGAISVTNGGGFRSTSSVGSLINNGVMSATGAGSQIFIQSDWMNNGAVNIVGAGSELDVLSDWASAGTISVTDGNLELGGSFTTMGSGLGDGRITGNAGSRLQLDGSLDNTGAGFSTDVFGGTFQLAGGRITGGSLTNVMGSELTFTSSASNVLDGVQVIGGLSLDSASATVRLRNGTTVSGQVLLTGSNARVGFESGQTISGFDFVATGNNTKQLTVEGNGTVTLGADSSISAERMNIGGAFFTGGGDRHFINDGVISANVMNTTGIQVTSLNSFTNNGLIEAVNGGRFFVQPSVTITNLDALGTLADGTYRVGANSELDLSDVIVTNDADIQLFGENADFVGLSSLGENNGALTIGEGFSFALDGALGFGDSSSFTVAVSGTGDSLIAALLTVNGTADLDGLLTLDFSDYSISGFTTETTVQFLAADAFSGAFDSIAVTGINADLVNFDAGQGTFTLVPAPGSLLVVGAFASLLRTRRRF